MVLSDTLLTPSLLPPGRRRPDGQRGGAGEAVREADQGEETAGDPTAAQTHTQVLTLSVLVSLQQQSQIRRKLFESSHSLRSMMFGQDRYKRRYWVLPQCGGIFVEGMDSGEGQYFSM